MGAPLPEENCSARPDQKQRRYATHRGRHLRDGTPPLSTSHLTGTSLANGHKGTSELRVLAVWRAPALYHTRQQGVSVPPHTGYRYGSLAMTVTCRSYYRRYRLDKHEIACL